MNLKELYKNELKKAWKSPKMVEHCSKQAAYIIEHQGGLYSIDRPSIKKDFCFGYGQNGISTAEDYERATGAAEHAKKSEEYFIEKNLQDLNSYIKTLGDILEDVKRNWAEGSYPHYMVATGRKYSGQTEDCKLRYFSIVNMYKRLGDNADFADQELIELLIEGYQQVKRDFEKRLKTYLKRYGTTKLRTWTYLSD